MTTAPELVAVARSQLGISEQPPASNDVPYTRWAGMVGQPWCDIFVSWCMAAAGLADVEGFHAYTPEHVAAFKARGRWHDGPAGMIAGDVLFFDFPGGPDRTSHVGIAAGPWTGQVVTIEGNTDEAGGRTGGQVMTHTRTNYIVGYGRPDYEASESMPLDRNDLLAIGIVWKACADDLQLVKRLERLERKATRSRRLLTAIAGKVGLAPAQRTKAENNPAGDESDGPELELADAGELDRHLVDAIAQLVDVGPEPAPPRPPVDVAGDTDPAAQRPASRQSGPRTGKRAGR